MKRVVIETDAAAEVRDSREAILAAVARVIARRRVRGLRVEGVVAAADAPISLVGGLCSGQLEGTIERDQAVRAAVRDAQGTLAPDG
jgi:hypothetical protein